MGIVSDDEFEAELNNSSVSRPAPASVIVNIERGRGEGNVEVPNSLRQIIGETHQTDGRQEALALAKEFGISPSSTSAYAVGATSTASYNEPVKKNADVVNDAKMRVATRARSKMMTAMKHITDDKLRDTKPRELAAIAKDMSAVIKNIEPEEKSGHNGEGGPTFIFYAPRIIEEKHFDVVHAKE